MSKPRILRIFAGAANDLAPSFLGLEGSLLVVSSHGRPCSFASYGANVTAWWCSASQGSKVVTRRTTSNAFSTARAFPTARSYNYSKD